MSVKSSMDKTMTALENGKTKMVGLYDILSGLSVKNKMNFDVRLDSDKASSSVWKKSFSYDKEFRVMPFIWISLAVLAIWASLKIGKHCS